MNDERPEEIIHELSNFEEHVKDSEDNVGSWPMLIYKAISPVMHFITHISGDEKKLYVVSKEKWHGLYILVSGEKEPDEKFHRPENWFKMVTEEKIKDKKSGDIFTFYTRKNGTMLLLIILALIGIAGYAIIKIIKILLLAKPILHFLF